MRQFIAPKVLKVNGLPAICECEGNTVCWACTQAALLLWERQEGGEVDAQGASIIALREAIKKRGLRGVARELGVDHKAVTDWIKKKNVPERYLRNGDLMGKEAVSA
jgi:hypothetical protein